ncbi:MAG: CpsB/CapC family capsule biosynthesis tyrosine phosphatase [Candidatus Poribacteria bacterium]
MIDIHSHILPGVDDGAKSIQNSIDMLRNASKAGVRIIVATPHLLSGMFENGIPERLDLIKKLQNLADRNAIKIQIKPGYECYISPKMIRLGEKLFEWTINNNRKYMLLELPMQNMPLFVDNTLDSIKKMGITPIIAHPERYVNVIKDPKILIKFIEMGCVIQLNAGSILNYYGRTVRNTARTLLERNYIHVVASDMHSTSSFMLSQALSAASALIGFDKASQMFDEIPYKIVMGEDFEREIPMQYNIKRKSLRERIFGVGKK